MDVVAFFQYITKSGIFLPHITKLQKLIFIDYIKQFLVANSFYRTAAIFEYECKFLGYDIDHLIPKTSNSIELMSPIFNSDRIDDRNLSEIIITENINDQCTKNINSLDNKNNEDTKLTSIKKKQTENFSEIEDKLNRTMSLPNIYKSVKMSGSTQNSRLTSSSANSNKYKVRQRSKNSFRKHFLAEIKSTSTPSKSNLKNDKYKRSTKAESINKFHITDSNGKKINEQRTEDNIFLADNSLINSSPNHTIPTTNQKLTLPKLNAKVESNLLVDPNNYVQHLPLTTSTINKSRDISNKIDEPTNVKEELLRNEIVKINRTTESSPSNNILTKYDNLMKRYLKLQTDYVTLKRSRTVEDNFSKNKPIFQKTSENNQQSITQFSANNSNIEKNSIIDNSALHTSHEKDIRNIETIHQSNKNNKLEINENINHIPNSIETLKKEIIKSNSIDSHNQIESVVALSALIEEPMPVMKMEQHVQNTVVEPVMLEKSIDLNKIEEIRSLEAWSQEDGQRKVLDPTQIEENLIPTKDSGQCLLPVQSNNQGIDNKDNLSYFESPLITINLDSSEKGVKINESDINKDLKTDNLIESNFKSEDDTNNFHVIDNITNTMKKSSNIVQNRSLTTLSVSSFINDDIYFDLNFNKIISDLQSGHTYLKLKLLQALRWRLTHSSDITQIKIIKSYVNNDLFCLTKSAESTANNITDNNSLLRSLFFPDNLSTPHPLQKRIARLVNAVASLKHGRDYLTNNSFLLDNILLKMVLQPDKISVTFDKGTEEMVIATLQKLSLRNSQRLYMISQGMVEHLLIHLSEHLPTMSVYQTEYETALLMNLCLHKEAQNRCALMIPTLINLIKLLLKSKWTQCLWYINGTMYSLFFNSKILNAIRKTEIPQLINSRIQSVDGDLKEQLTYLYKIVSNAKFIKIEEFKEPINESGEEIDLLEAELDRGDNIFDNSGNDPFTGECFLYHEYREMKGDTKLFLEPKYTVYHNRPLQYNCTINVPIQCTFLLKEDKTADLIFSPSVMQTITQIDGETKSKSSESLVTVDKISDTVSNKIIQTMDKKDNMIDVQTSMTDISFPNVTVVDNGGIDNKKEVETNIANSSEQELINELKNAEVEESSKQDQVSIKSEDSLHKIHIITEKKQDKAEDELDKVDNDSNVIKLLKEKCNCGNSNCLCELDVKKTINTDTPPTPIVIDAPNTNRKDKKLYENKNKHNQKESNTKQLNNKIPNIQNRQNRIKKIKDFKNITDNRYKSKVTYAEYVGQYFNKPTKNEIFQRKNETTTYACSCYNLFPRSFTYSTPIYSCKKHILKNTCAHPTYTNKCLNNCQTNIVNKQERTNQHCLNKYENVKPINVVLNDRNYFTKEYCDLKNIDNLNQSKPFLNNVNDEQSKVLNCKDKPYTFFSQLSSPECVFEKCKRKSSDYLTKANIVNVSLNEKCNSDDITKQETLNDRVTTTSEDASDPFITRSKLARTPTEET